MQTFGQCNRELLHAICVLLAAGLLLICSEMAVAQKLDAAEVTNRQYLFFVLTTGRTVPDYWEGETFPEGSGDVPVTMVDWYDARDYCAWKGKRLPSQDEWRRACQAEDFPKIGDIWEWTRSEEEGWKILCGPKGTCDCSHRYRPEWKNVVKGFRCVKDQPMAFWSRR
jgi:formylglycine-generating enzyme required for sulfatase activity